MKGDETYRLRRDGIVWRAVEDEIVALKVQESLYLAINKTGAILWPALLNGTTHGAMLDIIVENFEVDRPRASTDLDAFLQALAGRGLIEPA